MIFCFLCEPGNVPQHLHEKGYVWVHQDCVLKLLDFRGDLEEVKKILAGEKDETVVGFIKRMQAFDDKFDEIKKKMKEMI